MIDPDTLSPEKRGQILTGAAMVFTEDGYEGASMSGIARAANVSKGTLYNHFESKAQLFRAYMDQACARHLHIFAEVAETADLKDALEAIGRGMMDMMLTPERRALYRIAVAEAQEFPELAHAFYEAGPKTALAAMARWIAAQVRQGRLATDDAEFAAEQFFALCQTRLCMRYRLGLHCQPTEPEVQQVVHNAVATFLARYRATP